MKEKEIIKKLIEQKIKDSRGLERVKREIMKKYKILSPSNVDLLRTYHKMSLKERKKLFDNNFSEEKNDQIKHLLKTRPVRSLSGIVNVSLLTKAFPCPGKCIYCPEELGLPKSYLSTEPAVMRAIMNKYDPEKQIKTRIKALEMTGHSANKIELRIIGGTWSFYPKKYQENFIKKSFDACNNRKSNDIKEAQKINEKSKYRVVGLSIETRPDFITPQEIKRLRNFGVTSVELGVQSIYDDVLKKIKRGHDISKTIEATKILKEAGFKICYQLMPNLPGSNPQRDKEMFEIIFKDQKFQPDYLKIYPTSIISGTELYDMWKEKKYKPYTDIELKNTLKDIIKSIPSYVRIQRLIRDIPAQNIEAGSKTSNLRQIIEDESHKEGWSCKCIRCREIKGLYDSSAKLSLLRKDYFASDGIEIFLSFEDEKKDKLYSLLRLRINHNNSSIFEKFNFLKNSALIREVHTYGQQSPVKKDSSLSPQHKGLGKKLINEAEKIVFNEFHLKKIAVISASGTRNYYRKLGYRLKDTYMIKSIKSFSENK